MEWRVTLAKLVGTIRSLLIYRARPGRARRMRDFYAEFVRPGDLCLDVGAHVGDRIAAFRRLGARVVAIEPQPHLARLLRRLHGRDPEVTILEVALGSAPGEAVLRINRRNPTLSSLSAAWLGRVESSPRFPGERWDDHVVVPLVTLDTLIAEYGLPTFAKIDVEGFEQEVLAGLSQPLPALSFEVLPEMPETAIACVWRVAALGPYRFNFSPGESFTWGLYDWVGPADMADWLRRMGQGDGDGGRGGDVYARLEA